MAFVAFVLATMGCALSSPNSSDLGHSLVGGFILQGMEEEPLMVLEIWGKGQERWRPGRKAIESNGFPHYSHSRTPRIKRRDFWQEVNPGIPWRHCGFGSDPLNKTNISIKRIKWIFSFPVHVKVTVTLNCNLWVCNSIMYKNSTYLNLGIFYC